MAHAESQIVIKRPVAEVYAFLADGVNNAKWRTAVVSTRLLSGKTGEVGSVYVQTIRGSGGQRVEVVFRVTHVIPDKELTFELINSRGKAEGHYYIDPAAMGTLVRFVLDLSTKGLMWLMDGMICKAMQAEMQDLLALKQVMEAEETPPAAQS